mmetsp:Transcript_32460/g.93843  ORF Transcript_32460/g.93843 Transcript_32460/m.93843 type:complete len:146 (+) Transcript_32460:178-615(+)
MCVQKDHWAVLREAALIHWNGEVNKKPWLVVETDIAMADTHRMTKLRQMQELWCPHYPPCLSTSPPPPSLAKQWPCPLVCRAHLDKDQPPLTRSSFVSVPASFLPLLMLVVLVLMAVRPLVRLGRVLMVVTPLKGGRRRAAAPTE